MTFGQWIRSRREEKFKGVAARQVAMRLGISQPYLHDLENDKRLPSESLCQKMAQEFGLNVEDVLARASVMGKSTEEYLKHTPDAIRLVRYLAEHNLTAGDIAQLMGEAQQLIAK